MLKKFLNKFFYSSDFCCSENHKASSIRKYLSILYPTSEKFKTFSDEEIVSYYLNLHFFYRVPLSENGYTGIFSKEIQGTQGLFMHPDTVAVVEQKFPKEFVGYTGEETINGSNGHYIEVSSFGWMQYPYGGYYNAARGSGVYLYTGNKTLAANNKLIAIYQMYKENNKEEHYIENLINEETFIKQMIGHNKAPDDLLSVLTKNDIDESYLQYKDSLLGVLPTLLGCIIWEDKQSLQKKIRACKNNHQLFRMLISDYFIPDHLSASASGNFAHKRYRYILVETLGDFARQDRWLYFTAKKCGYDTVQLVRQANAIGIPTFEIMDSRWPAVDKDNIEVDSVIDGLQNYDVQFAWNKICSEGFFSVRDPFDLMNEKRAIKIERFNQPAVSTKLCSKTCIAEPPEGYDKSWLPSQGWGMKQCKDGLGSFPTDRMEDWAKLRPSPYPFNKAQKECRLVSFAADAFYNNGFSVNNIQHNIDIFQAMGS